MPGKKENNKQPEKQQTPPKPEQVNTPPNKVNNFDYNNPPNSHSLNDPQGQTDNDNQNTADKKKSHLFDYLLFAGALLLLGLGIAFSVLFSPWFAFMCGGAVGVGVASIIIHNKIEQTAYIHNEQQAQNDVQEKPENDKKKDNNKTQQQAQKNEIPKVENHSTDNPDQSKDNKPDMSSLLKNLGGGDDAKDEPTEEKEQDKEQPQEVVETKPEQPKKTANQPMPPASFPQFGDKQINNKSPFDMLKNLTPPAPKKQEGSENPETQKDNKTEANQIGTPFEPPAKQNNNGIPGMDLSTLLGGKAPETSK